MIIGKVRANKGYKNQRIVKLITVPSDSGLEVGDYVKISKLK